MTNKQIGENSKYPQEVITWKLGEVVPEWISDRAKVTALEATTNNVQIDLRNTNTGGYEIIDADGINTLVKSNGKEDIICREALHKTSKIFSLSPIQFKLIYGKRNI